MTEELEQLLKNLKLRRILEIYDEQLRAAEKEDVTYSELVTRLVRAQWHARQEGALEWRIRRANLPERWSLETFPFARQPGVNRKQIRAFAELDFIAKAENIVLVGKTGVGKTGLSCGLLLKALENGYRCQFIRAVGFTVMVKLLVGPEQLSPALVYVGVTVTVATTGEVPLFDAVNRAMLPVPEAASPIPGLLFVHA